MFKTTKTSPSNVFSHCLPLVLLVFLSNWIKIGFFGHKYIDWYFASSNNLLTLSSVLCFNWVLLTLMINIFKVFCEHLLITVAITSYGLALISNHLLYLDSIISLTVWLFLSNYTYVLSLQKLWPIFRSSFSMSEFLIVSQLCLSYLCQSSACLISKVSDSSKTQLFCAKETPNLILQFIFFGMGLIVFLELLVSSHSRNSQIIDLIIISSVIFSVYCLLFSMLWMNPIQWLINYMFYDHKRVNLMFNWSVILAIALIFTIYYTIKSKSKANTITRKVFHFLISLVFLFGFKYDINYLSFSSASILAVFILIEIIRIRRIPPFHKQIESAFDMFRDEKDSGILTLTHIYLLIGFVLPIWLSPSFDSNNSLAMASGLITVGFGDTAASIGGTLFGKHRWRNSKKTVEGTICSVFIQLITSLLFIKYFCPEIPLNLYSILILFFVSIITSLLESNIKEIDNLVLPLYHYILIKILL